MIKNLKTSDFDESFVMKRDEIKNPNPSESNRARQRNDLVERICCSGNQILGNLFAALRVRQNPKLHIKVPKRK